ncbi:Gfo/Idh/MocA family oxidoreductase [Phyllobacterium sp. SB3]|uniref:Gfo/Idh/MocA family protein n=1 Tax=Phyllobacterium sp. SB3 TaxID=3156073 RepID=UPI0032AEC42B
MSTIKLAIIGTGFFSQYHYEAWTRIPEVHPAALVYSTNAKRAAEFAKKYGISKIFDDVESMIQIVQPDLIDIVSPPETHLPIVEMAARYKIPVITQKPLSENFHTARQLVDVVRKNNTFAVTHENWRFKPWFREAAKLIEQGAVGDLYSVNFRMRPGDGQGPNAYLDRQPYFQKMPRFLIHETAIHMVDVFRFLFGEVAAVTARLRRLNPVIAGEDAGIVVFDFTSGAAGIYDGNRLSDVDAENPRLTMGEMLIEGSSGQIKLDGYGQLYVRNMGRPFRLHQYTWENRGYSGDCVYALQRHVIDHLMTGSPVENRVADYFNNLIVEQAIYQSDAEGRRILIDGGAHVPSIKMLEEQRACI